MNWRQASYTLLRRTGVTALAQRLSARLGHVPILMYHSIGRVGAKARLPSCLKLIGMEVAIESLEAHVDVLRRDFRVIPLDEVIEFLKQGKSLPRSAVAITFDDGYKDNFDLAAPLLEQQGVPATFFIIGNNLGPRTPPVLYQVYALLDQLDYRSVSLRLEGLEIDDVLVDSESKKWDLLAKSRGIAKQGTADQQRSLIEGLRQCAGIPASDGQAVTDDWFMSAEEVLSLHRRGFCVGGHSMTHANLAALDAAGQSEEVAGVWQELRNIGVRGSMPFAYPFGQKQNFGSDTKAIVRAQGFSCGLATTIGLNCRGADPYELCRIEVRDFTREELIMDGSGLRPSLKGRPGARSLAKAILTGQR